MKKNEKYRPNEREKMIKAGFPICYENRHCETCIKRYRKMV